MSESLTKILYVDDESINLSFFKLSFQKEFSVITTTSPFEALEILKNDNNIPLVVTDFRMPGMNGMELVKEIKKLYPEKPCVLITGFMLDEIDSFLDAKDLIHSFIQKPWNRGEVLSTFMELLKK